MKLTLTTFLTLDGVMQGPGGPEEDRRDDFDLGGWLVPFEDDDMGTHVTEWFARADAFLLGRHTFDIFEAFWPTVTDPGNIVAEGFRDKPKHVVSHTRTTSDWAGTEFHAGDLRAEVEALKAQPGDELQIHGSGRLARSLHDLGLIDEYRLWTFPVVLGEGLRLFSNGSVPASFELVDHKLTSTGASIHCYRSTGPVSQGTFDIEDGAEVTR
jgi:dihydrofolate reductase